MSVKEVERDYARISVEKFFKERPQKNLKFVILRRLGRGQSVVVKATPELAREEMGNKQTEPVDKR